MARAGVGKAPFGSVGGGGGWVDAPFQLWPVDMLAGDCASGCSSRVDVACWRACCGPVPTVNLSVVPNHCRSFHTVLVLLHLQTRRLASNLSVIPLDQRTVCPPATVALVSAMLAARAARLTRTRAHCALHGEPHEWPRLRSDSHSTFSSEQSAAHTLFWHDCTGALCLHMLPLSGA